MENGDWVWARTRKKAFDKHQPSSGAPAQCKVNNNFYGKCNIQWDSDQMSANKGGSLSPVHCPTSKYELSGITE